MKLTTMFIFMNVLRKLGDCNEENKREIYSVLKDTNLELLWYYDDCSCSVCTDCGLENCDRQYWSSLEAELVEINKVGLGIGYAQEIAEEALIYLGCEVDRLGAFQAVQTYLKSLNEFNCKDLELRLAYKYMSKAEFKGYFKCFVQFALDYEQIKDILCIYFNE